MTYLPAIDAPTERKPALLCNDCGEFIDLTADNIDTIRAAWLTVNRGSEKAHFCPKCKDKKGPHGKR